MPNYGMSKADFIDLFKDCLTAEQLEQLHALPDDIALWPSVVSGIQNNPDGPVEFTAAFRF